MGNEGQTGRVRQGRFMTHAGMTTTRRHGEMCRPPSAVPVGDHAVGPFPDYFRLFESHLRKKGPPRRQSLRKPSLTELSCDGRRVHTRPTRATGHASRTSHDPVRSARLLRDGRIDERSLNHVSPLLRTGAETCLQPHTSTLASKSASRPR